MVWNFTKNNFQKANKYMEGRNANIFLAFNDERQGGVKSNDKV